MHRKSSKTTKLLCIIGNCRRQLIVNSDHDCDCSNRITESLSAWRGAGYNHVLGRKNFKRILGRDQRDRRSSRSRYHWYSIIIDVDCGCRGDWLLNSALVLPTEDLSCHKRSDTDVCTRAIVELLSRGTLAKNSENKRVSHHFLERIEGIKLEILNAKVKKRFEGNMSSAGKEVSR